MMSRRLIIFSVLRPGLLPVELPRYLQNPWIARAIHDSEVTGHIHGGGRIVELSMVEKVEPFRADLEPAAFTQLPDGEILVDAEIPIVDAEAVLRVSPEVAEESSRGCGVSGAVQTQQIIGPRIQPAWLDSRAVSALLAGEHV